jgi:regulator of protease activity HflC (stomatin/prohibitin superfamily)
MSESGVPKFKVNLPSFRRLPKRAGRLIPILLLIAIPIILLRGCFVTYLPPDRIGLRQISFGPGKGLQKEVVEPGYRRQIRGYETVRTFPRSLQLMEFTNSDSERSVGHRTMEAVNVPTVDGYPVRVDITVIYRIADPYLVVSKFGFGRAYEDSVVVRFTDPTVKQFLGELRAEEFYSDARLARVAALRKDLSRIFAENGLELADILARQYDYPDTFQTLTEQKKIQDQAVLANQALAKQAEVETRLKQTAAEGRNQISVKGAEFDAMITEINAQRDLYERQKRAEADLLVKAAEANGTEMINRAMEGAGSDKLLRLRKGLALLNGIRGPIYITGDPTDLGKLIR